MKKILFVLILLIFSNISFATVDSITPPLTDGYIIFNITGNTCLGVLTYSAEVRKDKKLFFFDGEPYIAMIIIESKKIYLSYKEDGTPESLAINSDPIILYKFNPGWVYRNGTIVIGEEINKINGPKLGDAKNIAKDFYIRACYELASYLE